MSNLVGVASFIRGLTHAARHCKQAVTPRSCSKFWSSSLAGNDGVAREESVGQQASRTSMIPQHADVVVIGGGSLGCQTVYHLAKMGVTNTVLLEKHALTAGTTWHTAGLVWSLRPSDTTVVLLRYMIALMGELQQETDMHVGWINNGGLFIANNKERLDEYRRLMTIGRALGVESHVLAPDEVHKVHPLLNTSDLYGCLYSPSDGTIDPAGLCSALSRAATRRGAQIIEHCDVIGIETEVCGERRHVTAVHTAQGSIKCHCVVNATGAWGNYIAAMAGVQIPLVTMKHAYVLTERVPGVENTPNVRDHDASVYLKLQGDALCVGGYENNPIILDQVERKMAFGLYDLDWDVFTCHIEGAVNRLPQLKHTGIKSTVCGPESFTPDHNPIMGEDPRVRGLFHNCGFNSSGMMLGGGCGWQLAEWIIHGRPSLDMYSYDIRRFDLQLACNDQWVRQKSHESYAKNYAMVFPHDEPLAARNQKKDALHEELLEQGCFFQERQGWERPGWFSLHQPAPGPPLQYDWYGGYEMPRHERHQYRSALEQEYSFEFPAHHHVIREECLACRNAVALFNMSYFGKFFITGPDAQAAVDWIFSNDLRKPPGSVVYTCMLNSRGGIESDLTVTVLDSSTSFHCDPDIQGRGFYVAVGGGFSENVRAHIMAAIEQRKFDVIFTDKSTSLGLLSIQGRHSRQILESLSDERFDNDSFPFGTARLLQIDRLMCRAMRLSFVGELGWELHAPSGDLVQLYRSLKHAGKNYGLVDAGYRALDSLSAEKGYKHWHAEIRPDDSPHQANMMFTCKLKTDVDFQGRSAVEKQRSDGAPRRRLATFTTDEPQPLWGLEGVLCDGQPAGFLRRVEPAFQLNSSIGYGYVSLPDGAPVTMAALQQHQWQLDVSGTKMQVKLHAQHPFDPRGRRLQGDYE